jgi:hypothetical protein
LIKEDKKKELINKENLLKKNKKSKLKPLNNKVSKKS